MPTAAKPSSKENPNAAPATASPKPPPNPPPPPPPHPTRCQAVTHSTLLRTPRSHTDSTRRHEKPSRNPGTPADPRPLLPPIDRHPRQPPRPPPRQAQRVRTPETPPQAHLQGKPDRP